MRPRDPKDIASDVARGLSGLDGELASIKGEANEWLVAPDYATLRYRLEAAHAAVEAALDECCEDVRSRDP